MKTFMKPLTHLLSPLYLLAWLFTLSLFSTTHAADLKFDPATPIVEINQTITLSVSGTVGQVRWMAFDGKIEGDGNQVTYFAPAQVGKDTVTVKDSVGSATVEVIITAPNVFSLENANWEVFTNRSLITALLLSENGKTLWVGTNGGLERRDAQTGKIQKVFTNLDGLPFNMISRLQLDGAGGLWVGTYAGEGLVHLLLDSQNQWTVSSTEISELPDKLPDNWINAIYTDNVRGLWVAVRNGLAHRRVDGSWEVFNKDNSGLPSNNINALQSDSSGGIWVGTSEGLAHRRADGSWEQFIGLPGKYIKALYLDSVGSLWIGGFGDLVHLRADGSWENFSQELFDLTGYDIAVLHYDDNAGDLWIGTNGDGLLHRRANGSWEVFNQYNSDLPYSECGDCFGIWSLQNDSVGGMWIGTTAGLAHRHADGSWEVFNTWDSGLPTNYIQALCADGTGGLWIGAAGVKFLLRTHPTQIVIAGRKDEGGGVAHGRSDGTLEASVRYNSNLKNGRITALQTDSAGDLWAGTYGGLMHRSGSGEWYPENSNLPLGRIYSLLSDNQGGWWIGTGDGGLAHRSGGGDWTIYNMENSDLPSNGVPSLLSDGQGGLWIGTMRYCSDASCGELIGGGLAHRRADGSWEVFTQDNSDLPGNTVSALYRDAEGDLWIGTDKGLALALHDDSGWHVSYVENDLNVFAFLSDGRGGFWMATSDGLINWNLEAEKSQVFNTANSRLPSNGVYSLLSDDRGGLWVGTNEGLAHLTFGKATSLLKDITDPDIIKTILSDKHAAIIIAAKGQGDTIWPTTKIVTGSIYKMLYNKGFLNSQIYYLSPEEEIDFNGDNYHDKIVDAPHPARPLKVTDVEEAFRWATQRGKLEQPLYFFFVDHGDSNSKLTLSQEESLEATKLKELLDNYQTTTGNEVILVIDACYSGILLDGLIDSHFKRAIISSTSDGLSYPYKEQSFSSFLANALATNDNFFDAFNRAKKELPTLLGNYKFYFQTVEHKNVDKVDQIPRFEDGSQGEWLKQVYINGNFKVEGSSLAVQELTTSTTLSANQSLSLTVEANFNPDRKLETADRVTRVWAVVRPPKMDLVTGIYGTPIVVFDYVPLSRSKETKNHWQTNWNKGIYNGNYEISFYAEDDKSNTASSNSIIVTVQNGTDPPPQAKVQIQVEKDRYQRGETLNATMVQQLGWGYDLYVAVTLPPQGEQYVLLNNTNKFVSSATTLPWVLQGRAENQTIPILKDFKLPADLSTGQYCLWAILSPQDEEIYETRKQGLWVVGREPKCIEVF
jgi:ligand-binding sensor domain-containing protein